MKKTLIPPFVHLNKYCKFRKQIFPPRNVPFNYRMVPKSFGHIEYISVKSYHANAISVDWWVSSYNHDQSDGCDGYAMAQIPSSVHSVTQKISDIFTSLNVPLRRSRLRALNLSSFRTSSCGVSQGSVLGLYSSLLLFSFSTIRAGHRCGASCWVEFGILYMSLDSLEIAEL